MLEKLLLRFGYVPDVQDASDQIRAAERALATAREALRKERAGREVAEAEAAALGEQLRQAKAELACRVKITNREQDDILMSRLNAMRDRSEVFA